MSAKLMGAVWELDLNHPEQAVLLALADHAHDDGSNCRPGVDYLAWKTGYSERQVRRILESLEGMHVLIPVKYGRGGRTRFTEYRIEIGNAAKKKPLEKADKMTANKTQWRTSANGMADIPHAMADKSCEMADISHGMADIHACARIEPENQLEPSENHRAPAREEIPLPFFMSGPQIAFARQHGYGVKDAADLARAIVAEGVPRGDVEREWRVRIAAHCRDPPRAAD